MRATRGAGWNANSVNSNTKILNLNLNLTFFSLGGLIWVIDLVASIINITGRIMPGGRPGSSGER